MLLSELDFKEYSGSRFGWMARVLLPGVATEPYLSCMNLHVWRTTTVEPTYTIRAPGPIGVYHHDLDELTAQALLFYYLEGNIP